MSTARDEIMGRVRGTLQREPAAAAAPEARVSAGDIGAALDRRISRVRPQLPNDIYAYFKRKAEANLFVIHEIGDLGDLPALTEKIVAEVGGCVQGISVAPSLAQLPWPQQLTAISRKGRIDEKVTVTLATAAIAETGSLVLCSGDSAPSSLNFAAEVHIIALDRHDVTAHLEDGFVKVKVSAGKWPRAVNVVSGPSRTADVAGIVVRPAHGPKAVHLVVFNATAAV